ncbi:MAG: class I SAM-dependent methyltransferase [Rhodobacteraceae bacterium]|nr:class I SAM-dependent methyltransferase [Paracoccaceae bacterium]
MSGFSPAWLALREPVDLAARNEDVETAFFAALGSQPMRIMDLASGAGSTVSALARHRSTSTEWLLTDYDLALLEVAGQRWQDRVTTRQIDLASDLEELPFAEVDAVTTSAFLDLVAEPFLVRLVDQVVKARKPFLASLTYDGRALFTPQLSLDAALLAAHNTHQLSDKGFGPALGPAAAMRAIELFRDRGYKVVQGRSDWQADSSSADFLKELLGGWCNIGREVALDEAELAQWWSQRQEHITSGQLTLSVGHVDFTALP